MDPEKPIEESESAPIVKKPIKFVLRCGRCMNPLDPEKESDPYEYMHNGKLCKKCVSELGLGKNQDAFFLGRNAK